jgi:hypothetical protein
MKKRLLFIFLLILVLLLFFVWIIRQVSSIELDDISPQIPCKKELIERSDIIFIIPKYNNIPISYNLTWCNEILSYNKTLALHGVYHTYEEFKTDRTKKYLEEGIKIFKDCFNKSPELFKPPQIAISKNNKILIKNHFKYIGAIDQVFHKDYHCSDTGRYNNRFMDLI